MRGSLRFTEEAPLVDRAPIPLVDLLNATVNFRLPQAWHQPLDPIHMIANLYVICGTNWRNHHRVPWPPEAVLAEGLQELPIQFPFTSFSIASLVCWKPGWTMRENGLTPSITKQVSGQPAPALTTLMTSLGLVRTCNGWYSRPQKKTFQRLASVADFEAPRIL